MRILLISSLLSAVTSGIGGHYSSMRTLRDEFEAAWPDADVRTMSIGNIVPVSFRSLGDAHCHIGLGVGGPLAALRGFLAETSEFRPTHIHAFDSKSYAFARLAARKVNANVFITKPGGPNPTKYFPKAPEIVCFSQESSEYFQQSRRHRASRVHMIPQRVRRPDWDEDRVAALREVVGPAPVLLRIARLTQFNRPSILQSIALSRMLASNGVMHSLVILGSPNDAGLIQEIRACLRKEDHLVTDSRFTNDAAALTPIARGVVGSGRTLIEGAMVGVVLYVPLADRTVPTLVTEGNWRSLAERNFSARSVLTDESVASNEEAVDAFLMGKGGAAESIASELELGPRVIGRYREIYETVQSRRSNPLDSALNWAAVILAYLKYHRDMLRVRREF